MNTVETTPYGPARQRLVIAVPTDKLTWEQSEHIRENASRAIPGVDILVIPAGYSASIAP